MRQSTKVFLPGPRSGGEGVYLVLEGQKKNPAYMKGREDPSGWVEYTGGEI